MMNQNNEGYSLERLEVYNWGTFDKGIHKIEPACSTALLTGKNGSGKSTLVDALLTLLVPNRKRTYNQASGDKRKERDEKSYVRGAFNRLRDSGVQYLREGNSYYTVLLAVFHNPTTTKPYVTIAQVFWYTDTLNKFYVIAPKPLSIAENFTVSGSVTTLKKSLRQLGVEVHDQFNEYSASFRKLLHLRSEKALEIFSQTVSIKEIGSLNHFIREHMLEKTDAEDQIQKLRDNFHNLTTAHEALVKAERQQVLLTPIIQEGDKFDQLTKQIEETEAAIAAIPHYFTFQRGELLRKALSDLQRDLAISRLELDKAQTIYNELDDKRVELRLAIERDETGQLLARLRENAVRLQREIRDREGQALKYDKLATKIGLQLYKDTANFYTNRQYIETELPRLEKEIDRIGKQRDKLLIEIDPLRGVIKELEADIESLRQRRSQIPRQNLDIRRDVAHALGIEDDELPFVGELVRVRDQAQEWEGAIERVLHSFGLNMLVPEQHYKRLSQYVNKKHLSGRLIYRRINPNTPNSKSRPSENTLYYKIDVKTDSQYAEWLRAEIISGFNYVCTEILDDFHHERRAITINGQVKHDTNRYEKDDRHDIHDHGRYVLGWDNAGKLTALIKQRDELLTKGKLLHTRQKQSEQELQQIAQQQDLLKDFMRFEDFTALDWQAKQTELNENTNQKEELESSSNQFQQLQIQLKTIEQQHREASNNRDRYNLLVEQSNQQIRRFERDTSEIEKHLRLNPLDQWEPQGQIVHREVERARVEVTLENINDIKDQVRDTLSRRASNYNGQRNGVAQSLERQIAQFRMEYRVETENIGSGLGAIPELRSLLEYIVQEDLPRHRTRFKEMLNKKVLDNIEAFQSELETQVEDYKDVINQLNTSLAEIPYEASAHIQLQAETSSDVEISDFRSELRACFDNALSGTSASNEQAFERVSKLITRFEKEERWTNKVTDVRNWLNFAAIEYWNSDGSQKRYHSDSSGMSGGQKAKLAYTILASAVAYQYGTNIGTKPEQTFRFVVVDEAFSKVDDNNARYAMELFGGLGLQLLVVTPMDKVPVVEPYAGAYHLVLNTEEGNNSSVYNLTVEQFHQLHEQFDANTRVAGD